MIQNIKVDTIYYLTNSDFEMEFNLCGCCKMRLLTDKAENAKNFVGLLSRAVSRSQVIICCGKLFDNDGLINIVSKAIKKPLVTVDNDAYSIADSNEIRIIDGAVPLVNSDGCFCGCISESGPQSIILLTDNKGLRKTVLKQLIHPYIEELSIIRNTKEPSILPQADNSELPTEAMDVETPALEISEDEATVSEVELSPEMLEALQSDEVTEDTFENENSEYSETNTDDPSETSSTDEESLKDIENTEETAEKNADEDSKELNNSQNDTSLEIEQDSENTSKEVANSVDEITIPEFILDETDETAEPSYIDPSEINSGFELYLEPERVKYSKKSHYALNYIPSDRDNEFISQSSDSEFFDEAEKGMLNLPIMIVVIILLAALAALAYFLVFIPMRSDYVFSEYIKNIFSVTVNFKTLL